MKKILLLFITMCFLQSGCSIFSPIKEHPVNYYTLSSSHSSGKSFFSRKNNRKKLVVAPIVSQGFYNTPRMVYTDQELQLNYFAYQQWVAPPAQLLTTQLVNYLLSHHFVVVDVNASLTSRFILKTELLDFKQDYTRKPAEAIIGVRVQLDDVMRNRLLFIKTIYVSQPFYVHDAYHGVRALNQAKLKLFKQIGLDLHRSMS